MLHFYWIRHSLSEKRHLQSWETQLGLYSDEKGLLRCRGRLSNAELLYVTKYPIHKTLHYVKDCHLTVKHRGVKETLTELRSQYWIVCGRNFVRKLIGSPVASLEGNHTQLHPFPLCQISKSHNDHQEGIN